MDPAALGPGEKLGDGNRYVIERPLARGGMGAVYVARDAKFPGVLVALKVALAVDPSLAEQLKHRFMREAHIGNLLGRTEGFVRAFDWGETSEGCLYLAMDLVEDARTLDLASGPLEARLARVAEAARLVARAHERRVIHRDLKPANFLVSGKGSLWLTDFGLSKILDAGAPGAGDDSAFTRTGASAGTPPFMPPEQFEDLRSVDERADVYALGVMLHMALSGGAMPYTGSMTSIIHHQQSVLEGKRPIPTPRQHVPGLAPALESLCVRALALRVEDRLPSAQALVEGLGTSVVMTPGRGTLAPTVRDTEREAPHSVRPVRPPSSVPRARPVSAPPARGGFKLWQCGLAGCLFLFFLGLSALWAFVLSEGTPRTMPSVQPCSVDSPWGAVRIVSIDGTNMSDVNGGPLVTPASGIMLRPGRHRFVLEGGKGERRIADLVVVEGQLFYHLAY